MRLATIALVLLTAASARGEDSLRIPAYTVAVMDMITTEAAIRSGRGHEYNPLWQGGSVKRIATNLAASVALHELGVRLEKSSNPFWRSFGWGLKRLWVPRLGVVGVNAMVAW